MDQGYADCFVKVDVSMCVSMAVKPGPGGYLLPVPSCVCRILLSRNSNSTQGTRHKEHRDISLIVDR